MTHSKLVKISLHRNRHLSLKRTESDLTWSLHGFLMPYLSSVPLKENSTHPQQISFTEFFYCCFAQHRAQNLLNCYAASNHAMLQGEMYYSEEFPLTRLVLLVEYRLKTESLKNYLKYKHVKEKKSLKKKIGKIPF